MNILKTTVNKVRGSQTLPKPTISCPCGSVIACKGSMYRHLKTKRHQRFVESGMLAPKTQAEYQRRYYNSHPELRQKHRELCKRYYEQNRDSIRQRQNSNGAVEKFRRKPMSGAKPSDDSDYYEQKRR